jgi:hypothetical protein
MAYAPTVARRKMLTWKMEDGPEDAPSDGSPDDIGPAWIVVSEGDELVEEERVLGGEWITRAEAIRMAQENGCEFEADDGSDVGDSADVFERMVALTNQWLRDSRFDEALYIERSGDDVLVHEPNGQTSLVIQRKSADVFALFMEVNERLLKHAPSGPSSDRLRD